MGKIGETKKSNFWEDFLGGLEKGWEIAEKVIPFFGLHSRHARGPNGEPRTSSISGSVKGKGWVGIAQPTTIRGPGAPKIRMVKDGVYELTHQGELTALSKVDSNGDNFVRGDVIFSIALNPEVEEWLSAMAKFEKYRFVDVAVTYIPSCPTTVSGKIIGWFESDVDNPELEGEGEESIRRAMSSDSAAEVDIWTQHTWVKSFRIEDDEWWYCGSSFHEARLAYQGRFSIMAGVDLDDADLPTTLGDLIVTYRIELTVPNLNNGFSNGASIFYYSTTATEDNWFTGVAAQQRYDDGSDPAVVVPDALVCKFDSSVLYPPAGYWSIDVWVVKLGGSLPDVSTSLVGNARALYMGTATSHDTAVYNWVKNGAATHMSCSGLYAIPDSNSGVTFKCASGSAALDQVWVNVQCLGGALPYFSEQSAIATLTQAVRKAGIAVPTRMPNPRMNGRWLTPWQPPVRVGKSSRPTSKGKEKLPPTRSATTSSSATTSTTITCEPTDTDVARFYASYGAKTAAVSKDRR
jgi:hypothetical protein